MNLDQITTKCWILALFERDDGERLLLGDGWYDFKDSLQHFQPNIIASDIVELQGTDGQLLAGQVRRTASQSFDGYIGDAITSKTEIENRRRQFIQFFRVRRFYKVIYIFPDGSAIQRKRGYLTDAPSVPEMWQKFPEYHVALNFEDVSYYEYSEDEQGKEIYANTALIELLNLGIGGLVWDSVGAVSHGYTWLEPVTLTGDYITISDGLEGAPLSLTELDGNATQTTYSGKNLLPMKNTTRTINSVTFTPQADGSIKLSGTASAQISYPINVDGTSVVRDINLGIGTYTVSWGSLPASGGIFVQAYYVDGTSKYSTGTFTISNEGATLGAYIRVNNGVNTNGAVIYPMLETGSSATSYEPYVGGTASPNPDYPQAINTVTGEQTVEVVGKNLFDINTLNKGSVTVTNGVASATALQFHQAFGTDGIQPPIPNQQFSITATAYTDGNVSTATTTGLTIRALYTDGTQGNLLAWDNSDTTASTKTGTTSNAKTLQAIRISYNNQGGNIWHLSNVQLEVGSTATSYEAYQSQSQEVTLASKNVFDPSILPSTWTNTSAVYKTLSLAPNTTYTFSSNIPRNSGNALIFFIEQGQSIGTNTNGVWEGQTRTLTTNSTGTNLQVVYRSISGESYTRDDYEFQLEKGSTATTYTAFYSYELAKIGTYQDKIYKDEGKWYIEKQVGKVVFVGANDEGWTKSGSIYYTSALSSTVIDTPMTEHYLGMSNYFEVVGFNYQTDTNLFFHPNKNLQVKNTNWATLSDWTTWLGTHPTTVYYALATPTTTEITDETLLEQLEHIYSLYGGVNHISITPAAGAQGTMEVKYYTVLDTTGAGYEWEPGGGSSTTTVEVAGIDNAEPIWTVTGPATNPTLTNITTGQAITWNGTVPAGQTLTVDMGNQSATLAGANVYQFISGSWITLRPGPNKLSYSATGGAEEPSQLEWNGVVG